MTESVRVATTDPWTFSHSGGAGPKGVILTVVHGDTATQLTSTVTYGGSSLSSIQMNQDTLTEPGRSEVWFLGSSVPTGTQTVSVDLTSATVTDIQFVCITLNGSANLEIVDQDGITISATQANPTVTLNYGGRECMSIGALYWGGATPPGATGLASGCEEVFGEDLGAWVAEVMRQSTPGTSDFQIGYTTLAADDVAFSAVAVAEVAAAATSLITSTGFPSALMVQ